MTATMTAVPQDGGVPAGEGLCGRAGCGRPLPAGERGRSRRFCSDECRRRHYNALRGKPAPAAPVPDDGPGAVLGRLSQLLAEASRLAATASAQVAETDSARIASVLAEAEASRRGAEAHAATATAQSLAAAAQSAESAESAAVAWEAADAADAARVQAEERARTVEEQVSELERQLADVSAGFAAAEARTETAEHRAAQAAADRDTAIRERDTAAADAQRAAADLAAARQAGEVAIAAARRQAERETTAIQAACQAREEAARELAAAATARAETALDTESTERRALTDRLTTALAQAGTRNRTPAIPQKDKQPRAAQLRPASVRMPWTKSPPVSAVCGAKAKSTRMLPSGQVSSTAPLIPAGNGPPVIGRSVGGRADRVELPCRGHCPVSSSR